MPDVTPSADLCAAPLTAEEWGELRKGHRIERKGTGGMYEVQESEDNLNWIPLLHEDDEEEEDFYWDRFGFDDGPWYPGDLRTARAVGRGG